MKSLIAVISAFMGNRSSRSNLKTLLRLVAVLLLLVIVYSVMFHLLMEREVGFPPRVFSSQTIRIPAASLPE